MLMITGGAFQGKLNYALELTGMEYEDVLDCEKCSIEEVFSGKVLYNFHAVVNILLKEDQDVLLFAEEFVSANPDAVIILNEVGGGVIPIRKEERKYREAVGRMSCYLAKKSKEVHRVMCGLGMRLDHDHC